MEESKDDEVSTRSKKADLMASPLILPETIYIEKAASQDSFYSHSPQPEVISKSKIEDEAEDSA